MESSGPARVIVHGSITSSEQWAPPIAELRDHFAVYALDRRGRGLSGDAEPYSIATEVEDIRAVATASGEGAHVLGHSYGGLLSLAYVREHGVDGTLFLFEPPLAVDGPIGGESLVRYRAAVEEGDLDRARELGFEYFIRATLDEIAQ